MNANTLWLERQTPWPIRHSRPASFARSAMPRPERANARPALETLRKALDANSDHNRIEDYSIALGLARAGDIKAALMIVDAMAARDQSSNQILLADLAAIEAEAGDFPAARASPG